ncbi:hypothetical protein FDUTEX481_08974 [Tolypothrix sp. PCC 7601]|nr:hypothetical protein FDUTEX481_08974 [Tolypothrix sp. PCC 7601]
MLLLQSGTFQFSKISNGATAATGVLRHRLHTSDRISSLSITNATIPTFPNPQSPIPNPPSVGSVTFSAK